MKLICNGNDLSDAVGKVIKAVSNKGVNPIAEGILLRAEQGTLTLTAFDTDITIEKAFNADIKIEGSTVVPGKLFCDFVKRLTKEQIELILDEKNRLRVKYAVSEGTFLCYNPKEFPKNEQCGDGQTFVIKRNEFKDLINKTAFGACLDEGRPVLRGVFLEIVDTSITAVALDGYRLARCVKPIQKSTALMSAIVPARCLSEIARLIDDSVEPLEVSIHKGFLKVDLEHTRVISRLIEGEFINYKQIIPDFFSSEIVASRVQFEESLERAVLLSRQEKSNLVSFDISTNSLIISSNSDVGEIEERVSIKLIGDDLSISFNAKYFTELIKFINTDSIVIKFTNAVSPCVIEPSSTDKDVMYLVLPVRLSK